MILKLSTHVGYMHKWLQQTETSTTLGTELIGTRNPIQTLYTLFSVLKINQTFSLLQPLIPH